MDSNLITALRQGIKNSRLQCWKDLIGEVEKDPWSLAFKIVTKRLVTRRKTPGLDNADRVKYILRSLLPHVELFQRQDRSSCVVRREDLFTLEELKRAGGRLEANTSRGIDEVPNEILKEVIGAYPEILLEAFNSCLREGKFFVGWKKQVRAASTPSVEIRIFYYSRIYGFFTAIFRRTIQIYGSSSFFKKSIFMCGALSARSLSTPTIEKIQIKKNKHTILYGFFTALKRTKNKSPKNNP